MTARDGCTFHREQQKVEGWKEDLAAKRLEEDCKGLASVQRPPQGTTTEPSCGTLYEGHRVLSGFSFCFLFIFPQVRRFYIQQLLRKDSFARPRLKRTFSLCRELKSIWGSRAKIDRDIWQGICGVIQQFFGKNTRTVINWLKISLSLAHS